MEKLQQKMDSLQMVIDGNHAQMDEMDEFMSLISSSLDSISQQEGLLYVTQTEESGKPGYKKKMLQQLDMLGALVERQRVQLEALQDSLSMKETKRSKELNNVISFLTAELAKKDQTIKQLQNDLAKNKIKITELSGKVTQLAKENMQKEELITAQETALTEQDNIINEGYVIMGTKRELIELGVLSDVGILRKAKLNLDNVSLDNYKKIDIRDYKSDTIVGRKVTLLTHMPTESYSLIKNEDDEYVLDIIDNGLFWSLSKFLVIQVKR
jgi:hypothetical protein